MRTNSQLNTMMSQTGIETSIVKLWDDVKKARELHRELSSEVVRARHEFALGKNVTAAEREESMKVIREFTIAADDAFTDLMARTEIFSLVFGEGVPVDQARKIAMAKAKDMRALREASWNAVKSGAVRGGARRRYTRRK